MSKIRNGSPGEAELRMKLQYGFNESDHWWHFAKGRRRKRIWSLLKQLDTRIMRLFLFDKHAPDPVQRWDLFRSYVDAVLEVGAKPMITFSRFGPPMDDPRGLRNFCQRCTEVAWSCLEQWGGERVANWYWCVWNEPNNSTIGGGLSFEAYREIYEEVAQSLLACLKPHLNGGRALIGGPAVDGFQNQWFDWIWRFVSEIDNSLIGFVSWHRYGDWREGGECGAPRDESLYRRLLAAQTPDYGARARGVGRVVASQGILNICGELNVHSHMQPAISARFNKTVFGAAYYVSALLHLMRGGADMELWWTATDDAGTYGVLSKTGVASPVFWAKLLCAKTVSYGDWISFPGRANESQNLEVVVSRKPGGERKVLMAHLSEEAETYPLSDWLDCSPTGATLHKIDRSTGNRVAKSAFQGTVKFEGYGVAAIAQEDA